MKKYLFICILGFSFILPACTDEEITNFFYVKTITVSGKTLNLSNIEEPEASIEGIYISPGNSLNPVVTSDNNGDFSLQLLEDDSFYLRATKSGFVSVNTARRSLSDDETGIEIKMPTETETQDVINSAFVFAPQLVNHAWLLVDTVNTAGEEVIGQSVVLSAAPSAAAYLDCDGSDSGLNETTGAPCPADRSGPMYITYFDTAGEIDISVGNESQTASIKMGEITRLEFELQ